MGRPQPGKGEKAPQDRHAHAAIPNLRRRIRAVGLAGKTRRRRSRSGERRRLRHEKDQRAEERMAAQKPKAVTFRPVRYSRLLWRCHSVSSTSQFGCVPPGPRRSRRVALLAPTQKYSGRVNMTRDALTALKNPAGALQNSCFSPSAYYTTCCGNKKCRFVNFALTKFGNQRILYM